MSSASARATSACTSSWDGACTCAMALAREAGDVRAGDALVGEQHRDAVLDAVDGLVVAGDQAFLHRRGLRAAVDAPEVAGRDGLVECLELGLVEYGQGLLAGGAAQDVEELPVHGGVCGEG